MTNVLNGLNEPQKEAVITTEGPLLLLAGAGSGKTRVITHRIAYLVLEKKILPYRICAVTFTNKAAEEMRSRVINLMPNSGHLVTIKTFHSLCLLILRRNPTTFGLKSGFTIYDTSLSESLIKEILKDLQLDVKSFKPSQILNIIQSSKDKLILPKEFDENSQNDSFLKSISKIYSIYENRKQDRNAVDFGDLILKTVLTFRENKEVLSYYNDLWEYVMVDEYQDTNRAQYLLSLHLSGKTKNLCVVGDDDQSIYSWRGADIRNILDFEKDFHKTKIIKLEENYRSSSNIIQSASILIKNNTNRKSKNIFTNNPAGEKIKVIDFQTEMDESFYIRNQVEIIYKKTRKYLGIAIFYRTNAQSRFFEEELRKKNIPYRIYGGFRFFDRAEIKDMIAYLTILINPDDSGSLLRIINFPPRGIGETSIEKMRSLALKHKTSIFSILLSDELSLRKASKSALLNFHESISRLQKEISEKKTPSEIAKKIVDFFGIDKHLQRENDLESTDRLENIQQLIESIKEYEESTNEPSLEEYLNQIALLTSEEDTSDLKDYVTLMTVHNSKGLEFPNVYLTGMEEGTFPHFMSMDSDSGIEEERRLLYVAITRAKEELTISYCKTTRKYGEVQSRFPSRFLEELPEDNLEFSKPQSFRFQESKPYISKVAIESNNLTKNSSIHKDSLYHIGQKIKHKDYGIGKILEISGSGDNQKAKIQFGNIQKNFLLAYSQLEIL
jgi:DNA helicase II / ATP-dependent DNA helicase PcrA